MDDSDLAQNRKEEDALHDLRKELDRAIREKEELAKENRQLKDKEEEYYNQTGEAQQESDDLKKQLANVESEKVQIGRELANLIEVHEKAAKENMALRSAEEKLRETMEAQRAERETLDMQLKTGQRHVKDLRQDLSDVRKELKSVQGQLDNRTAIAEGLRADLDEASERIAEMEQECEAGEVAQETMRELQQGLEDTFEHLGKNLAIDEYLMHIRNLQNSRPRRNPSEDTLERTAMHEKTVRIVPKRQLSMADELNGFDTDEDDELEDSYSNVEADLPVHDIIHEYDDGQTPRRFDTYTSGLAATSPPHSPKRPFHSRYTRSISDGPKLSSLYNVELENRHRSLDLESYAASKTSQDITTGAESQGNNANNFDDLDSEDVQSALDKHRARYDLLFQQLQEAQETNQHLEEQVAPRHEELKERDTDVKTETTDEDTTVLDSPRAKMSKAGSNPWLYTILATIFAIYFAFTLHYERSQALWANDLGPYPVRRMQAPGPFWQAVERIIGFDRTQFG